ncbi:MAG: hypothetical protein FE037_05050 [Thermoplasmata archaeon]|nr:MAG: hypothetical protein FE037_05050 [Thermoplasmata archaeon]
MSFGKEYIQNELKKIDDALCEHLKLYLIGGGNMSLLGLKDATKDMDVILNKEKELYVLRNALLRCGYVEKLLPQYQKMGSKLVMENRDGFRWDVFIKTVCHSLVLSPGMIKRCIEMDFDFENLRIFLISKEDMFLFKGVTERERDLEDMHLLFLQGLDFEVIKEEIKWQSENSDTAWIAYLFQRLLKLKEEYGIVVPDIDEIEKMAEEDAAISLILEKLSCKSYTVGELAKDIQQDKNWIEYLLRKLEGKGKIERKGDIITRKL